jgi:hypothetical protein
MKNWNQQSILPWVQKIWEYILETGCHIRAAERSRFAAKKIAVTNPPSVRLNDRTSS